MCVQLSDTICLTLRQDLYILTHMSKYIQKLKNLRMERNLSQDQVAKALEISRTTYISIESGKQTMDLEEVKKLSSFFGIDVSSLVSGNIPNIEKYKHMILSYLRMDISKDGKVPKTKLAKLLYLADFAWFYNHLESMSGMEYRKIAYGPVPDMFFRAIDELEESGKISVERKNDGAKDMFLISESDSNRNEKINTVSKEEGELMKKILVKWRDKKTQDIVNFTHNQLPYFLCRENEVIPYELITQEEPSEVY